MSEFNKEQITQKLIDLGWKESWADTWIPPDKLIENMPVKFYLRDAEALQILLGGEITDENRG